MWVRPHKAIAVDAKDEHNISQWRRMEMEKDLRFCVNLAVTVSDRHC